MIIFGTCSQVQYLAVHTYMDIGSNQIYYVPDSAG